MDGGVQPSVSSDVTVPSQLSPELEVIGEVNTLARHVFTSVPELDECPGLVGRSVGRAIS